MRAAVFCPCSESTCSSWAICIMCHLRIPFVLLVLFFERSEFLIDTSQNKSLRVCTRARVHACTRVRLILVVVCGIMYHIRTYLVSARLPRYVYVDTYVPGLHPRPKKKNRRPSTGSGSDTRTTRQSLHSKVHVTTTVSVTEGVPAVSWIQSRS